MIFLTPGRLSISGTAAWQQWNARRKIPCYLPVEHVGRNREILVHKASAGIVDEGASKPAVPLANVAERRENRVLVKKIEPLRLEPASKLLAHRVEAGVLSMSNPTHLETIGDEFLGDGAAHSASRARDHGYVPHEGTSLLGPVRSRHAQTERLAARMCARR